MRVKESFYMHFFSVNCAGFIEIEEVPIGGRGW